MFKTLVGIIVLDTKMGRYWSVMSLNTVSACRVLRRREYLLQ